MVLARKYNCDRMICRKCYARLPAKVRAEGEAGLLS